MSIARREVYTTGQVAKICRVTIRTVIKWYESGRIKGYKIPASKDRRIPHESLVEFLRENELPVDPSILDSRVRILIADDDPAILDVLRKSFEELDAVDVHTATNGYEAGFETARLCPQVLLIDYNLGDMTADRVLDAISRDERLAPIEVIVMTGYLGELEVKRLQESGLRVVRKPFDIPEMLKKVRSLISA